MTVSGLTIAAIMGILLLVFIFSGYYLFAALGGVAILSGLAFWGPGVFQTVYFSIFKYCKDYNLLAVPLFVLMGQLLNQSGVAGRLFDNLSVALGRQRGGMAIAATLIAILFAATTGIVGASVVSMGLLFVGPMLDAKYNKSLTAGVIVSGGTLGILIPPSTVLILYGSLTDQSVVKLFAASAIPGIVLTLMFMVYIFFNGVYLKKKGQYNIVDTEAESLSTWQAIKGIAPIVITIVVLLGSLYTGKATPVESAALGTFIVLVFGFASKGLSWKKIVESAKSTSKSIAMILTLMISASYLTFALSQSSVNRHLTTWVIDQGFTPLAILTIIGLIYLVLGCFMDGSSMIMLTIPLLAPICKELGVDLIWFGVYITLLVQIGQVTPPMGLNLFMVQGIDKEAKLNDIIRGVIPFLIGMLIFAVLMIMFPQMTAWLPEVMGF